MKTEKYLMLGENGAERWTISKAPLTINEGAVIAHLSAHRPLRLDNVMNVGGPFGMASVIVRSGVEMWSVRVRVLVLEAPFQLSEQIHTPSFHDLNEPTMRMEWKVPDAISLILGITSVKADKNMRYAAERYLMAFDDKGEMWRLPLANVYEDGKLCHGQGVTYYNSAMETVLKSCEQFVASKWNADLYGGSATQIEKTRRMFRWKANEKGFDQLEMEIKSGKDWTSLCTNKIASENLSQLIINVP